MKCAPIVRSAFVPTPGKEMSITALDTSMYKGCAVTLLQDDANGGTLVTVLLYVGRGTTAKFTPTSADTLLVDLPEGSATDITAILGAVANYDSGSKPPPPVHV